MTAADLKRLRELEAKATTRPWIKYLWTTTSGIINTSYSAEEADAAFIAEMRNAMPALLDEIERLRKGLRDVIAANECHECLCCRAKGTWMF